MMAKTNPYHDQKSTNPAGLNPLGVTSMSWLSFFYSLSCWDHGLSRNQVGSTNFSKARTWNRGRDTMAVLKLEIAVDSRFFN